MKAMLTNRKMTKGPGKREQEVWEGTGEVEILKRRYMDIPVPKDRNICYVSQIHPNLFILNMVNVAAIFHQKNN